MSYQNLLGLIPPLVLTDISTKLNEVAVLLDPYVVNLTMGERSTLYKMGPTRNSLVQKTIQVCDTHPIMVPVFVSVQDLKDDYEGYGQLSPLLLQAQQIAESINDTMMARGSEALTQGVKPVYNSVLQAREQNIPGADADYELLNPYFDLPDQPDGANP
ncbi:MAG: hypothetical protein V4615_01510 [Bacteroidota bacterium]